MIIDYIDILDRPPLTEEQKAAMRRVFAKCAAWCAANPDLVPRLPHYRHTCLNPETCTRDHDSIPTF